jgi:hypothetical protein
MLDERGQGAPGRAPGLPASDQAGVRLPVLIALCRRIVLEAGKQQVVLPNPIDA